MVFFMRWLGIDFGEYYENIRFKPLYNQFIKKITIFIVISYHFLEPIGSINRIMKQGMQAIIVWVLKCFVDFCLFYG